MLRSLGSTAGEPAIEEDGEGLLRLSWPLGRPEGVELATALLEDLVEQLNGGRRAINVLMVIAQALGGLVPSPPDNSTGAPTP